MDGGSSLKGVGDKNQPRKSEIDSLLHSLIYFGKYSSITQHHGCK